MSGLIICSYIGWVGGTTLGTLASGFLPESVISALNIALYAMFIAIIIPPARESKPVTFVIIISVIISCILNFIPAFDKVSSGWIIIICGVISSALGAWAFPLKGGGGDE
ncbi:MAG: branched-chain amino acid ABC transporter permease, partial [Oscillospiraceae bacterium]